MYYSSDNEPRTSYSDVTTCLSPVLGGWSSSSHCRMTDGPQLNAPAEQSANYVQQPYYGRPSYHQTEPESSSRLAFLYDRACNSPAQPSATTIQNSTGSAARYVPSREGTATSNGFYHGKNDQENDVPPPLPTSSPPSGDYKPMSRAVPAPICHNGARPPVTNGDVRQMTAQSVNAQQPSSSSRTPANQTSSTSVDQQMTRLGLSDRHLPPVPNGASSARSRDTSNFVRSRAMLTPFTRRQSAPGPCLPPSSCEISATGKKQWALTPCGFTNTRGQQTTASGRCTPSTPFEHHDGMTTPQSATPRTDGPRLLYNDISLRNRSFGSQDSFLDYDNSPQDNTSIDRSSIRYNLREGDEVGDYDQTSIRYTGKANPSKTFRLLQSATGSDTENDVKLAQAALRRQVRRRRPTQEEVDDQREVTNADDIVDISYVGSNIPSRTFRCLQEAIGVRAPQETDDKPVVDQPSRSVKVIHLRPSMKKHSSMDNILSYSDL